MHASLKKLNEMNRLSDMTHFPAAVNAGATLNILATISFTYWLVPRYPQPYASIVWVALVLFINLLPVVLLRLTLSPKTVYRSLRDMNFIHDQHKFSDWVYLAASANMAFWILISWTLFTISHTTATLFSLLTVAFLLTFSPILLRTIRPAPAGV